MATIRVRAEINRFVIPLALLPALLLSSPAPAAVVFRVAAYNIENYLDHPSDSHPQTKSAAAKAKVRESIRGLNADVVALEEMGGLSAFMELRASLKAEGTDFPYWEFVNGADTNIHVAVLSRLPIVARRPHTNEVFLLERHTFHVQRGFAEVDIQATPRFTFTLIAAHLKSRRPVPGADQAQERFQEAKILRRILDKKLAAQPGANLVVLGDFNDLKDSASTKEIIGHGRFRLVDTRPAERNEGGMPAENPWSEPREITWTHYYGKEDTYSRIDYILLSPAMARVWVKSGTCVLTMPDWGLASDHRPIVAAFKTESD